MSTRRAWMCAAAAAAAGRPLAASAQAQKRVGVLIFSAPPDPQAPSLGFAQGMRELGPSLSRAFLPRADRIAE